MCLLLGRLGCVTDARTVGRRIANSEQNMAKKPEVTMDLTLPVQESVLEVILEDLRPFDAYSLVLTIE
jgi:hypothetical protein